MFVVIRISTSHIPSPSLSSGLLFTSSGSLPHSISISSEKPSLSYIFVTCITLFHQSPCRAGLGLQRQGQLSILSPTPSPSESRSLTVKIDVAIPWVYFRVASCIAIIIHVPGHHLLQFHFQSPQQLKDYYFHI